jgi:preprotein translocase subunit SecF
MERLKNYIGGLRFEFVKHARVVGSISALLVLASWVLFIVPGPRWGIDFTGGTEMVLKFDEEISIDELRNALTKLEIPNDAIQEVGGAEDNEFKVRIQDPEFGAADLEKAVTEKLTTAFGPAWIDSVEFNPEVGARFSIRYKGDKVGVADVRPALEGLDGVRVEEGREDRELIVKFPSLAKQVEKQVATAMGDRSFEVLSVDAVGPKVGASLRTQGVMSLVATLGLILVYTAFRFDLAYAPGAVLALIHDVSVTVGIFIVFGKEFNLTTIGALLTILGYSLNDTIVIYDRIRENRQRYSRHDLAELVDRSINETLTRTFATAGTTLAATLAFLVVGTDVIQSFVQAITLGIVLGTYSTIFVASPSILVTERLKPWFASLVASSNPAEDDPDGIPEQFTSESERRRRERELLSKATEQRNVE